MNTSGSAEDKRLSTFNESNNLPPPITLEMLGSVFNFNLPRYANIVGISGYGSRFMAASSPSPWPVPAYLWPVVGPDRPVPLTVRKDKDPEMKEVIIEDLAQVYEDLEEDEEEDTVECDRCGAFVPEGDEIVANVVPFYDYSRAGNARTEWNTLCESCSDNHTFQCGDCERNYHMDSHNEVGERSICGDCICEYNSCGSCDTMAQGLEYSEDDDCYYCEDHMPRDSKLIHGYDYKPTASFFGRRGTVLYYGVELEVNTPNGDTADVAEKVLADMNNDDKVHIYLKKDGSLSSGFEIVSHPHSFDASVTLWKRFVAPDGVVSHNGGECGMHVHVSRKYFSPLHLQKLIVFINAPENTEFIKFIAQRDPQRWAKILEKKIGHALLSEDRYEAINITNRHTVEFRIFRGNTLTSRILKNLEFVKASIEWTKDRSYRELTATAFKKYIARNKALYPNLHEFIFTQSDAQRTYTNDGRAAAVGQTVRAGSNR